MKLARVSGAVAVAILLLGGPASAQQTTFSSGSLIVPMDIDYQDAGMLRAFGLVYNLLLNDVPVAWCILPGKSLYTGSTKNPASPGNSVDFTATARDVATGTTVTARGYRGGPFVIDAAYKARALSLVNAWNAGQKNVVNVHEATAAFTATVDRFLVNAPNIGVNADGNEGIAYGYMNAAGIPDSLGKAWSGISPDVMTPAAVAGPTTSNHRDGRLWGATGQPRYCQLMSMHWTVSRDSTSNETIAEMREFLLNYPVHLFAECQAVNQVEDATAGHFVSTDNGTGTPTKSIACDTTMTPNNGLCAKKPTPAQPLEFLNSHLAFAQMDGPFTTVGGSEPAYGLAPGSAYYDAGIVMIREKNVAGGANGKSDLWMTGYANFAGGICNVGGDGAGPCAGRGKVSYLGGHQYSTNVPISTNGATQGTRLFLNSLLEADCATAAGSANVTVNADGPATTSNPLVTFTFSWSNSGAGVAVATALAYTLPAGVSFVSATNGGVFSSGKVTWSLGDLAPQASGTVSVTVALASYGTYNDSGAVTYKVGNNTKNAVSNIVATIYGATTPDGGTQADSGGGGLCAGVSCPGPVPANPCRVGVCNPSNGSCGMGSVADGTPCDDGNACTGGTTCTAGTCGGGGTLPCSQPANPCQVAACVSGSGCVVSNVDNGVACSSGDKCAIGQSCMNGTCSGGGTRACPIPDSPCENPTCDPATGCGFTPGNDGASCDDGDACTSATTCGSGLCQGGTTCPAPSARCTVAVCGANGCEMMLAMAGTDPRGDCPAIGGCIRTCDGAGSCTICPGATGAGGADGGAGSGGASGGGGAGGGGTGGSSDAGSGDGSGGASGTSGGGGTGTSGGASGSQDAGPGGTGDGGGAGGGATVDAGGSAGGGGSSAGGQGGGAAGAGGTKGSNAAKSVGCGCTFGAAPGELSGSTLVSALAVILGALRRRSRRAR